MAMIPSSQLSSDDSVEGVSKNNSIGAVLPALAQPSTEMPSIWLRLTVLLIGAFAFLQVYSVQAILPILMQDFGASETEAGLMVGATVFAIALISPFMGMLSDAVGRKNIIIGSIVFMAFPTIMMGFTQSIHGMMVWRFLQGLAVPGITVVAIAYVGEEFAGKVVSRIMSFYVSGSVLGGFLGRFIMGHLQELIGWRQACFWMGSMTFIGALWVWFNLPASKNFVANKNLSSSLEMLWQHLHNRYVITACLLGACVLFSLVGCFTYINLHLADTPYQLNSATLANIFAVYLVGVVITPIASTLISKFGAARMVMAAVPMSMLGVVMTLVTPLWVVVAGLAIMSSGVFITQSATITYVAVNVKEGRSLASGLYYMSYYVGGSLGAWVCGYAYAHNGWSATAYLLLGVQVLAMLMASFGLVKKVIVR